MIEPIDPILIPHYTGDLGELEKAVASLKKDASDVRATGADTHSTFQHLAADYDAPERDQLLATTVPVRDQADRFAHGLETVQAALSTYASEIGPIVKELDHLREQAAAFRDSVKDDEHWQKNQGKVDENARLIRAVAVAQEKFHAAERDAVNKITAVYCGTTFLTVDDGSHKPGMYGYDPKAVAKVTETPWGTVAKREPGAFEKALYDEWHMLTHNPVADFAKGFVVDGTWGTARGLMTAFGWDGKDQAAAAWKNLGLLAAGSVTFPLSQATRVLPDSWLPKYARDYKKAANAADKGFLAWDEWKKNPYRATGAVSFNGLTILIPEARAAGLARAGTATGRVLTTVARIGEIADPVNLAAKGVGRGFTAAKGALESARVGDLHKVALENAAHLTERIPGTNEKALKLTTADEIPTYIREDGTWLRADGSKFPTHGVAPKELKAADHRVLAHAGGGGSPAEGRAMGHPGAGPAESSAHGNVDRGRTTDVNGVSAERPSRTASMSDDGGHASHQGGGGPQHSSVHSSDSGLGDHRHGIGEGIERDADADGRGVDGIDHHTSVVDDEIPASHDPGWGGAGWVENPSEYAADVYETVRGTPNSVDLPKIADHTGIDESVLREVKTHLFRSQHDIATGPNQTKRGPFTPRDDIAQLWMSATEGKLDKAGQRQFRHLMAHEYVESKLMKAGMPYVSHHPDIYDPVEGYRLFPTEPRHFGAHDVAPNDKVGGLKHWKKRMGLKIPPEPIAKDLSNIDDIVKAAMQQLRAKGLDLK
ncbi:apolipoprotein A1/A4/E family protein [Streptomyces sp. ET3-23]|uniref:apolipoprotein A1/A4/E family protein n=1 Tax=Streptomyces sp. ET3-23 TaxID=2885643 RepID=UPI001D114D7D|nr:apolipoprotein A1/A4/E family protein [Streptomyces sp. ET3-23]MCC2278956.1 apolipoprotein A1/A4/E family protein [Streptomyces sp. ET3-23]